MKNVILPIFLLLAMSLLIAQPAADEAIQSLENARLQIEQKNWAKAQEELDFARTKLSEIQAEELLKYIPEAPQGWTLEDKNSTGLGSMGSLVGGVAAITATGEYANLDEGQINLTISVGGILGQTANLAALGQLYGGAAGKGSKAIRIGSYNGTQEFDSDAREGRLSLQVGSRVSINLEGYNISNSSVLSDLLEKIDLAKLEKSF